MSQVFLMSALISSMFGYGAHAPATTSMASVAPHVIVEPKGVVQGESFLITVAGTTSVASVTYNGRQLPVFQSHGKLHSIVGIDLRGSVGNFPVVVTLRNGKKLLAKGTVAARPHVVAPLGIPEKLGGNTKAAEQQLVTSLVDDGKALQQIVSTSTQLWSKNFVLPLEKNLVTDVYGYTRQTGSSEITHKGTDFRAAEGTKVFAMNDGVVVIAKSFRSFGNMIAIDHGQGIVTLYLHLSHIDINVGDRVRQGQLIGLSGSTGYAEGAHLHISVRIRGISIDPMSFMKLLGKK